jgi:hypothetical protein
MYIYDDIEDDVWRVEKPTGFVDAGGGRDRRVAGKCYAEDLLGLSASFRGDGRRKHGEWSVVMSVPEAS